jgi:V8-like Glu-specific endopeptidase
MSWKKVFLALAAMVFMYGCCSKLAGPELQVVYRDTPHIYKAIARVESPVIGHPLNKMTATAFAVNKKYLVTAGHFCHDVKTDPELSEELNLVGLNNNFEKIDIGSPKIVKYDMKRDLCLLRLKKHGVTPLEIVKKYHKNVRHGDEITIVGAPNGVFPIETHGKIAMPYEDQKIVMAIPAFDGNSGSPVLNEVGQVVGVAIEKDVQYHHVIYATPAIFLRKFLKKNKVVIH